MFNSLSTLLHVFVTHFLTVQSPIANFVFLLPPLAFFRPSSRKFDSPNTTSTLLPLYPPFQLSSRSICNLRRPATTHLAMSLSRCTPTLVISLLSLAAFFPPIFQFLQTKTTPKNVLQLLPNRMMSQRRRRNLLPRRPIN